MHLSLNYRTWDFPGEVQRHEREMNPWLGKVWAKIWSTYRWEFEQNARLTESISSDYARAAACQLVVRHLFRPAARQCPGSRAVTKLGFGVPWTSVEIFPRRSEMRIWFPRLFNPHEIERTKQWEYIYKIRTYMFHFLYFQCWVAMHTV